MDINKRLYTFGCSFTKYKWPTWADFIGNQFEIYENLFIASLIKVHQANVLIMVYLMRMVVF
jgi:hypothetical protein